MRVIKSPSISAASVSAVTFLIATFAEHLKIFTMPEFSVTTGTGKSFFAHATLFKYSVFSSLVYTQGAHADR